MANREDNIRAHSARLAKHLAVPGQGREDVDRLLGNGADRERRAARWTEELSFWTDYTREYPNLAKAAPYQRLLATVGDMLRPASGEVWWDAGCGPLAMTKVLWEQSQGTIGRVVASDIVLGPARHALETFLGAPRVELLAHNLGVRTAFPDATFDGIAANLVVPYVTLAEDGSEEQDAVEFVLREFFRVLRPGGSLVWSVPRYRVQFLAVFVASIPSMLNLRELGRVGQGLAIIKRALKIQRKGRQGLYSFLTEAAWEDMLRRVGFTHPIGWQTSFARQAWIMKTRKPYPGE